MKREDLFHGRSSYQTQIHLTAQPALRHYVALVAEDQPWSAPGQEAVLPAGSSGLTWRAPEPARHCRPARSVPEAERFPRAWAAAGLTALLPLTSDTGAFWFFDPTNIELVVKVLDGRAVNGKFWVFYGALSDVDYTLTVTDTATGAVKTYHNPAGQQASVADTSAF